MIQFKRGKSSSWRDQKKPLADGQPGYDKERHKLKIGDGKSFWDELPDASGLRLDEILDSEESAKKKTKAKAALNPLGNLIAKVFNLEDRPIITYGSEAPDDDTVGQIYLQHYETEPETDYIISSGIDGIWEYHVYKSGAVHCWGTLNFDIAIQSKVGNGALYTNSTSITKIDYPFTFKERPSETVTLTTAKNKVAWLASKEACSTSKTGLYTILSYDKHDLAPYGITFDVKGKLKD